MYHPELRVRRALHGLPGNERRLDVRRGRGWRGERALGSIVGRELDEGVLDRDSGGRALNAYLGDLYTESWQTLQGSFLAVSKPNFATRYSLKSSRRDLHNALLCTVILSQVVL